MKHLLILILLTTAGTLPSLAETNKKISDTLHVEGVCNMCKERIETAVDVEGVVFAEWDVNTKKLVVVYNPKKVNIENIHQLLAAVGHTTNKVAAANEHYQKLPGCCRYKTVDTH